MVIIIVGLYFEFSFSLYCGTRNNGYSKPHLFV